MAARWYPVKCMQALRVLSLGAKTVSQELIKETVPCRGEFAAFSEHIKVLANVESQKLPICTMRSAWMIPVGLGNLQGEQILWEPDSLWDTHTQLMVQRLLRGLENAVSFLVFVAMNFILIQCVEPTEQRKCPRNQMKPCSSACVVVLPSNRLSTQTCKKREHGNTNSQPTVINKSRLLSFSHFGEFLRIPVDTISVILHKHAQTLHTCTSAVRYKIQQVQEAATWKGVSRISSWDTLSFRTPWLTQVTHT